MSLCYVPLYHSELTYFSVKNFYAENIAWVLGGLILPAVPF